MTPRKSTRSLSRRLQQLLLGSKSHKRRRNHRASRIESLEDRRMLAVTAVDDCYNVLRNTTTSSTGATICDSYQSLAQQPSVLDNDLPVPGSFTAEQLTYPSNGTMNPVLDAGGFFGYTPDEGFLGNDSFEYKVTDDSDGSTDTGTVTLVVHRAPYGQDDKYETTPDTELVVSASGVLANDRDPDEPTYTTGLQVHLPSVTDPLYGSVYDVTAGGGFTYMPPAGFTGVDRFTYQNYDGGFLSDPIEVRIIVTNETNSPLKDHQGRENRTGDPGLSGESIADVPVITPGTCSCEIPQDLLPTTDLTYQDSSRAEWDPAVNVDTQLDPNDPLPDRISVQLRVYDKEGKQIYRGPVKDYELKENGVPVAQPGDILRFALRADLPNNLEPGHYTYKLDLISIYPSGPVFDEYNGSFEVDRKDFYYDEEEGKVLFGGPVGAIGFQLSPMMTLTPLEHFNGEWKGLQFNGRKGEKWWSPYDSSTGSYTVPPELYFLKLISPGLIIDKYDTYYYFTNGLLTKVVDRNDNTTLYTYDGQKLTSVTDPYGRVVTYTYAGELLTDITDWTGRNWQIIIDSTDRLLEQIIDPLGNVTNFLYDPNDPTRLMTIDEPGPRSIDLFEVGFSINDNGSEYSKWTITPYVYEETQGQPTTLTVTKTEDIYGTITDPVGNVVRYQTDKYGLITKTIDDLNRTTVWSRDNRGLALSLREEDPDGAGPIPIPITMFDYDQYGNVLEINDPAGRIFTWTYDGVYSQVTSFTDPLSRTTTWTLDGNGNAVLQTDPDGLATDFTFDPHGYVSSITLPDADGSGPLGRPLTSITRDSLGRVTQVTSPDGTTTTTVFDNADRPISRTDERGTTWNFSYDLIDRKLIETADVGGFDYVTTYSYVYAEPFPVTATDPLGRRTDLVYDVLNNVTSLTDPLGNEQTFLYDGLSQLLSVDTPLDKTITYTYDAGYRMTSMQYSDVSYTPTWTYGYDQLDRMTSLTDPGGNTTTWEIDVRGFPIKETDPLGRESTFTFDNVGNLLTATNPRGAVTAMTYDIMDRLLTVTGPDALTGQATGPVGTWTYTPLGAPETFTDPLGNVTSWQYDIVGQVVQETLPDPDGAGPESSPVWSFTYDAGGLPITQTDPLGRVTSQTFDALARLTAETFPDPDGTGSQIAPVWSYAYDAASQLVSLTDPLGNATTYQYDLAGRMIRETLPDPGSGAPVYQYAYDADSNVTSITDPLGNARTWTYDGINRVASESLPDPDGAGPLSAPTTSIGYDVIGNVSYLLLPDNSNVYYQYDAASQTTGMTEPDPGTGAPQWAYQYDSAGNLIQVTDPLGQVSTIDYDLRDRQTTATDENGGQSVFGYDLLDRLTSLTDSVGNTTSWSFDGLGRVTSETNQLGDVRTFGYDLVGNLTGMTDRNGRQRVFVYDGLDRRTSEAWYDSGQVVNSIAYQFDALDRLTSASDSYSSYAFTLDVLGRVTSIDNQGSGSLPNVVLTQVFDQAGRRTGLAANVSGADDFSTTFTLDGIGRVTRVEQTGQVGGNAVADKRVDFAYDAMSRQTVVERYADLGGQNLVARTDLAYDAAGRLTDLTHAKGTEIFTDYGWDYDKLHRITSARWVRGVDLTYMEDEVANYAYDPTDQLLTTDYAYDQLPDESFSFDANGNRTMSGYATGTNNRLTSDGTYNYEYDQEGNRTKRTEIATGDVVEYAWDHRNRLVQVVKKDAQGVVTETVDIEYDLFDRKIEKTVTPAVGPAEVSQYVYDGDHLALRFENGILRARYLYGPAVDQIVAEERLDVNTGETENLYWPLTDNQGSVRDIAEYDVSADVTAIVESIDYSAFGEPLPAASGQQGAGGGQGGGGQGGGGGGSGGGSSSTIDFIFGYTAREEDDDVGLSWYRARWYDPATGRFVSEDPIGFSAGDTNLSRYVGNGPVNGVDPSGLTQQSQSKPPYDKLELRVYRAPDGGWTYRATFFRDGKLLHTRLGRFYLDPSKIVGVKRRKGHYSVWLDNEGNPTDRATRKRSGTPGEVNVDELNSIGTQSLKLNYKIAAARSAAVASAYYNISVSLLPGGGVLLMINDAANGDWKSVLTDLACAGAAKGLTAVGTAAWFAIVVRGRRVRVAAKLMERLNDLPPAVRSQILDDTDELWVQYQKQGKSFNDALESAMKRHGSRGTLFPGGMLGRTPRQILKKAPKNWRKVPATGNGWKLIDENGIERIRFMRPNSKGRFAHERSGYWRIQDANGNFLDEFGNVVSKTDPDFHSKTHIPYTGLKR